MTTTTSLGEDLEEVRLRHRADRLRAVLVELRRRTHDGAPSGRQTPVPLQEAIDGFQRELEAVRRRLDRTG